MCVRVRVRVKRVCKYTVRRAAMQVDLRMGGFDLIWDGGPVMRFDKPTSLPRYVIAWRAGGMRRVYVY
jgi:hypothetical protein